MDSVVQWIQPLNGFDRSMDSAAWWIRQASTVATIKEEEIDYLQQVFEQLTFRLISGVSTKRRESNCQSNFGCIWAMGRM